MKKTSTKGYLAPWSNRRETVGLMGTFFVFLLGLPSHSELTVVSVKHAVRHVIQLILVFLGLSTPTPQVPANIVTPPAAPVQVKHPFIKPLPVRHSAVKVDSRSMFLHTEAVLHRFTYVFEGKATFHGKPCPNASVLVRLISGDHSSAKGAVTEEDGSYSVQVTIDAANRAPVDWVVEAYTPDFDKVELYGRKIVQREEEQEKKPIVVTAPVEFILSSSK